MYYPKNKIKTGFYTTGNELLVKSNGKIYNGYYFTTFDNKIFSGKEPSNVSLELVKIISNDKTKPFHNSAYDISKNINNSKVNEIKSFKSIPTENDYLKGFMDRYFIKRVNGGVDTIKEVSYEAYKDLLKNPLYKTISIKWKLTGRINDVIENNITVPGIYDTNHRTLIQNSKIIPEILNYLINLLEFSRISE